MDEAKLKAIKGLVTQPAWEYIEEVFKEEMLSEDNPLNYNTEGKTIEMIALETMAREKSTKIIDKILNRFRAIGAGKVYKKDSYK